MPEQARVELEHVCFSFPSSFIPLSLWLCSVWEFLFFLRLLAFVPFHLLSSSFFAIQWFRFVRREEEERKERKERKERRKKEENKTKESVQADKRTPHF